MTITAESVGPANAPKIMNGSLGNAGLRSRGETAIHENRKAIAKNEARGNLEMALFSVCSSL
jgi:hypothetical protein